VLVDQQDQFEEGRDAMLHAFGEDALKHNVSPAEPPEKKLQAKMLSEMSAIDPTRAMITMGAWAKFVQLASRTRVEPFNTLEEYLPSRAIDAGELYVKPPVGVVLCHAAFLHEIAGILIRYQGSGSVCLRSPWRSPFRPPKSTNACALLAPVTKLSA
jgi:hypothetical protein